MLNFGTGSSSNKEGGKDVMEGGGTKETKMEKDKEEKKDRKEKDRKEKGGSRKSKHSRSSHYSTSTPIKPHNNGEELGNYFH